MQKNLPTALRWPWIPLLFSISIKKNTSKDKNSTPLQINTNPETDAKTASGNPYAYNTA